MNTGGVSPHQLSSTKRLRMTEKTGKLSSKDLALARVLKYAPWLVLPIASLPAPIIFVALFFLSTATDTAALYLLLAGLGFAVGAVVGLFLAIFLFVYRRRWLAQLRNRLASDGITADEVVWFRSELTSAERAGLAEIEKSNPLLADAYLETLATRLTASRIISRTKRETLRIERRMTRARSLSTEETAPLQQDLQKDRDKLELLRQRATEHLTKARTRLQTIEATASRQLNSSETDMMMNRLGTAQDALPLVLEIAKMEQEMMEASAVELNNRTVTTGSED
jgi:hypothetical protein